MIRNFIRLVFFWSSAFCAALLVAVLTLPWWFDRIEKWSGKPLPYEGVLRLAITVAGVLLIFGALVWLVGRGGRRHGVLWGVLVFSFMTLLPVFFLDTGHRLMEEFSWIRYTTAGLLALTAVASVLLAWQSKARTIFFLWLLLAGAFLYAGLDEVFEIHEALGRLIEGRFSLPHVTTDLITVGYATVALFVVVLIYRGRSSVMRQFVTPFPSTIFLFGGIVYFLSTMFDTVDVIFGEKLRTLAKVLSADSSFVFSDPWYVIWAPKNFFNGLEEVFEHTAATLFFAALLIFFLEKRQTLGVERLNTECCTGRRWWAMFGIIALSLLFVVPSLALSSPYIFTRMPLVSTRGILAVSRIAGYYDGLSHTDDLFYHPSWGVLVANEGKGNVYQLKSKAQSPKPKVSSSWRVLPDVKKVLRDTDSVTADENFVYVSDGSQGIIFRTDGKGEWEKLWTKKDGLKHPEGIVVVDGALYVVDESEKSLTKLVQGKKPEVWRPSHPDWRAPEGIAYDGKRGELLVTDDVSGVVFAVDFGKALAPIARVANPEDIVIAPDGRIFVTDNGWGAVFAIDRNGGVEKLLQFRRPYRDLQGITVDDEGRMYVVTADGFDRVSFMPSFLFSLSF